MVRGFKKGALLFLILGGVFTMIACGKQQNADTGLVVHTSVTPGGQFIDDITVYNVQATEVTSSDFAFNGKATGWMNNREHKFTADISSAEISDGNLVIRFDSFPEKYFYVTEWEITNAKDSSLNISSDQVTNVVTPVADDFETFSKKDGEAFDYHLFTPSDTKNPMPIVVVFHGYSDTHNLLCYRTSIAWAEAEAQAKRPCYVLSPVIDDYAYYQGKTREPIYDAIYQKLQDMIAEGKVDPNRIYIMGNSFGGMATIEFMEKYPNVAAAAMPLCSALNYSETAMDSVEKLTDIPMWIAQAENDGTIPSECSKNLYDALVKAGAKNVDIKIYSDDEMNAVGGSSDQNSTYSYHHVELAVMEDESYASWLFEQHK